MKVISGLLRGAAVLIMLFVIVALPLSLTARAIGRVFFSPETVVQLVEENFLDPELAASLVRDAVNERLNDPDIQSDPTSELLLQGVYNLDDEDWVELLRMVAPKELLAESLRQVVDGYYAWLDGPEAVPQMRVDVRPWKHNVSKNTLPVVELALNALPQCDAAQIEVFALALSGVGDVSGIPLCRPPEPIYSTILASAA
ncbi:MAG: hypothetical protein OEZ02_15915, partial [Anaerolineae bacterium]|nr:hypothetical protein [Anaerolineae bacterium]